MKGFSLLIRGTVTITSITVGFSQLIQPANAGLIDTIRDVGRKIDPTNPKTVPGKIIDGGTNPLRGKYRIQVRNACVEPIRTEVTWVPDNTNYVTSDGSRNGEWFTKTLSVPPGQIREFGQSNHNTFQYQGSSNRWKWGLSTGNKGNADFGGASLITLSCG